MEAPWIHVSKNIYILGYLPGTYTFLLINKENIYSWLSTRNIYILGYQGAEPKDLEGEGASITLEISVCSQSWLGSRTTLGR